MHDLPRRTPGIRDELAALDELLGELIALEATYGDRPRGLGACVARRVELLLESTARVSSGAESNSSEEELARDARELRAIADEAMACEAESIADELVARHADLIDESVASFLSHGGRADDVAVIVVDPRSPDLPEALRTVVADVHLGPREAMSELVRDASGIVGAAVLAMELDFVLPVVVLTFGRALVTTHPLPRPTS